MSRCVGGASLPRTYTEFSFSHIQLPVTATGLAPPALHSSPAGEGPSHTGAQSTAVPTLWTAAGQEEPVTSWQLFLRDAKSTLSGDQPSPYKHRVQLSFPTPGGGDETCKPPQSSGEHPNARLWWWFLSWPFLKPKQCVMEELPEGEVSSPSQDESPRSFHSHWCLHQAGRESQQLQAWVPHASLSSLDFTHQVIPAFSQLALLHAQGHALVLLPQQSDTTTASRGGKETTFKCKDINFP